MGRRGYGKRKKRPGSLYGSVDREGRLRVYVSRLVPQVPSTVPYGMIFSCHPLHSCDTLPVSYDAVSLEVLELLIVIANCDPDQTCLLNVDPDPGWMLGYRRAYGLSKRSPTVPRIGLPAPLKKKICHAPL